MRLPLLFLAATLCASPAAAQTCLHGSNETDKEKARKRAALQLVRRIHTAQALQVQRTKRFVPLEALDVDADDVKGFTVRLTTDGTSYMLLMKDATDPCGFAYASFDDGLIFTGHAVGAKVE